MIPVTIYLLFKFIFFYIFIRQPKIKNGKDNHNYVDYLDK